MTPIFPATEGDVEHVVAHLSEQNKAERDVYGMTDTDLCAHLAPLLRKGHSETTFMDGRPALVFGVVDGFTWFICTQAFFDGGIKAIRYSRERVAAVRHAEGKSLVSISRSPLPSAAKWFRALGFEEKPMRSVDGSRFFVYS